jgi:hypothetical protein
MIQYYSHFGNSKLHAINEKMVIFSAKIPYLSTALQRHDVTLTHFFFFIFMALEAHLLLFAEEDKNVAKEFFCTQPPSRKPEPHPVLGTALVRSKIQLAPFQREVKIRKCIGDETCSL